MAYVIIAVIFAFAGVFLGFVLRDRELGKFSKTILNYSSLTTKSKKYVDDYIHARMLNDERTTYRERRK